MAKPKKPEKKPEKKPMSSWQVMSSILKPNLKPTKEEICTLNSFFFCRYLASNRHSVPIADNINRNYNIPISTQYIFAKDYSDLVNLPSLVKFINVQNKKLDKNYEKILENIERLYTISRAKSEEYFNLMVATEEGQSKLDEIMEIYQEGKV